jgi:ribonucleoside-diphosphate reductase alpha chain
MATFDEAFPKALAYFDGDDLAADVFLKKYALTTPQGDILEETPVAMHRRLAKEFARIEAKYENPLTEEEIFGLMDRFRYVVPQGSPMAGIGNPYQIMSLSNCFVIPSASDSFGGIHRADEEQAQIMKRRGGVGHDVAKIRPKGCFTSNAAKTTDGIGVFMEQFSTGCRRVAQGGRRGALMLTNSVHHPEISTFINIKRDKKKVTGANLSVRASDEFMVAVRDGQKFELRWPVEGVTPKVSEHIEAAKIWDEIISAAWDNAEPGLLFWDTIIRRCPADAYARLGFKTISTNPCSELTLSAYDSCRLVLLNAWSFVVNPFTDTAYFDYEKFAEVTQKAQRLMDDLVDLEIEAIDRILAKIESDPVDPEDPEAKVREQGLWQKIRATCLAGRRTGLGLTAVGDTVAALSFRYGSTESVDLVEKIYKTLAINSYKSSCIMAKERGAFPVFSHELEKDHEFIQQVVTADPELYKAYKKYGRRNIALTTTAPAGSASIETQTSSGIECAPPIEVTRRKKLNPEDHTVTPDFIDDLGDRWKEFKVYHHKFALWQKITGKTKIEDSPYWKSTYLDIDWEASVDVQAAAQKWTCHAISKTVNLPEDVSKETVAKVYMRAWAKGCKGITVYREGSRTGVILSEQAKAKTLEVKDQNAPKRPMELPCDIHHVSVKGQPFTIIVGLMGGKPYEVFGGHPIKDLAKHFEKGVIEKVSHGKKNPATYNLRVKNGHEEVIEDVNAALDNPTQGSFTRLISTALRHGTPVQYLCEQLHKGEKDSDMRAFSRVMARVLKNYIKDGTKSASDKSCSSCGQDGLVYQEGCLTCRNCGASKCS